MLIKCSWYLWAMLIIFLLLNVQGVVSTQNFSNSGIFFCSVMAQTIDLLHLCKTLVKLLYVICSILLCFKYLYYVKKLTIFFCYIWIYLGWYVYIWISAVPFVVSTTFIITIHPHINIYVIPRLNASIPTNYVATYV